MPSLHSVNRCDGMSKLRYISLILVDPGVKADETHYCALLLSLQLLPGMRQVSGEFIFQQENASVMAGIHTTLVFRNTISQSSVAMDLRFGEIFNIHFTSNFLLSVTVKKF